MLKLVDKIMKKCAYLKATGEYRFREFDLDLDHENLEIHVVGVGISKVIKVRKFDDKQLRSALHELEMLENNLMNPFLEYRKGGVSYEY